MYSKKSLSTIVLAGCLWMSLPVSGCADNDASLAIIKVQPIQVEEETDSAGNTVLKCVGWSTGAGKDVFCDTGILDVSHSWWGTTVQGAPYYGITFLVGNYLINNANAEIGQTDTHKVRVKKVEMRYKWAGAYTNEKIDADPNLAILRLLEEQDVEAEFHTLGDVIESSTDGIAPGEGLVYAEIIPAEVGGVLAQAMVGQPNSLLSYLTLQVQVSLVGETTGNASVSSAPFNFVTRFCDGCLSGYTAGCVSPGQSTYTRGCFTK
ncbi:MAG: hypothetical protein D6806_14480 [Deltaproteobacteria bacterium]|nr:MAG: hypothetical protein D6806_14480 [Deltaproteobacteria bacterium]